MSMLSAQCDELRSMAESVGLAMPRAATLMMEAADTIWELRGSVHRERAEADTLRQQLADVTESMVRVEERCAKLRELAVRMFHTIKWSDRMSDSMYWSSFSYERELRELGVEVDG